MKRRFAPLLAAALFGLAGAAVLPTPALADKGCPPGLAKKGNGCMPPGQAKKQDYGYHGDDRYRYDDHYRYDDRYRRPQEVIVVRRGVPISNYNYAWVTHPERYGLAPPRDGWRYARVDRQIVRVDSRTYEVLDLIRAIDAILD